MNNNKLTLTQKYFKNRHAQITTFDSRNLKGYIVHG